MAAVRGREPRPGFAAGWRAPSGRAFSPHLLRPRAASACGVVCVSACEAPRTRRARRDFSVTAPSLTACRVVTRARPRELGAACNGCQPRDALAPGPTLPAHPGGTPRWARPSRAQGWPQTPRPAPPPRLCSDRGRRQETPCRSRPGDGTRSARRRVPCASACVGLLVCTGEAGDVQPLSGQCSGRQSECSERRDCTDCP